MTPRNTVNKTFMLNLKCKDLKMYSVYNVLDKTDGPQLLKISPIDCGYADPKGLFHLKPAASADADLGVDGEVNWDFLRLELYPRAKEFILK